MPINHGGILSLEENHVDVNTEIPNPETSTGQETATSTARYIRLSD